MLLVSGATRTTSRIDDPRLGALLRPGNGNRPGAAPWAIDNGAYTGFDAKGFRGLLARCAGKPGCLWVACPDVVGDATATLRLFEEWEPQIRAMGYAIALVAQDGLESLDVPWGRIECLFIGGTTKWKLGPHARRLAREAKERGKLLHVGRVNSLRRLEYAHSIGADSVDGTQWSRFADIYLRWGLSRISELEFQKTMFHVLDQETTRRG